MKHTLTFRHSKLERPHDPLHFTIHHSAARFNTPTLHTPASFSIIWQAWLGTSQQVQPSHHGRDDLVRQSGASLVLSPQPERSGQTMRSKLSPVVPDSAGDDSILRFADTTEVEL